MGVFNIFGGLKCRKRAIFSALAMIGSLFDLLDSRVKALFPGLV